MKIKVTAKYICTTIYFGDIAYTTKHTYVVTMAKFYPTV